SRIGGNNELQNLHITTPMMVPWFKPSVRRLNQISLLHRYQRLSKAYKIRDPILFAVLPSAADFMEAAGPALKIYYCCDDFTEYPGFNRNHWRAMENDLLDVVDALVVTSRDLEQKNVRSCPMLYLPHGVNLAHFHQAHVDSISIPQMESIPRP